jgi:biopolymer transport protein ExbD
MSRRLSYAVLVFLIGIGCSRVPAPMARSSLTTSSNVEAPEGLLEGKLEFNLPAAGEAAIKLPDDSAPIMPCDVTVSVSVVKEGAKAGGIHSITVQTSGAVKTVANSESLEQYLNSIRTKLTNKNAITVVAEGKLRYAELIVVMDACMRAGFEHVSIGAPPDLEK